INAGLADTKVRARLVELGGTVLAGSPADFGKLIADETEKWGKVVKFAGIDIAGLKSRSAAVPPALRLCYPCGRIRRRGPERPTVHHRADGRPDGLHGAIIGDGRKTWQSRLSGSGRFRLPGCIP